MVAEGEERSSNKLLVGILSGLILVIVGLGIAIAVLVFKSNEVNPVIAAEACRAMEEQYIETISDDELMELVDEFETAIKGKNEPNTDFESCYAIVMNFYDRKGNQEKFSYYEGLLNEIVQKDDRSSEELMKGVTE
ncbi:hypothetical protein IKF88_00010 [Candidatus Saccharibacteria bacterium]|nr:hypothetical protein [Candidatus Saccharibacteria bacterium]